MVRAGGKAMTKMKTIFAVIFLALLIPVLLAAPESEAKVYRGKCKSNLTWSYDSKTKTMVIDCKGDMPDDEQFYDLDMGWKEYYLKTKKVIFKKGISSIAYKKSTLQDLGNLKTFGPDDYDKAYDARDNAM